MQIWGTRQTRGSAHQQIVYAPYGMKLALMNGQTLVNAFVKLPGGASAVYNASGLVYYRHSDHLGNSRLATTPSRTKYYDVAYAPYGEDYNGSGTQDLSFTGQNQDTVAGGWSNNLYDFLMREYRAGHGRWTSPDPAGLMAVDAEDPQTWNRYSYVSNAPLNNIDPLGLIRPNYCRIYGTCPVAPAQYGGNVQLSSYSCNRPVGIACFFKETPDPGPPRLRRKFAANNGKTHSCAGTRIVKGIQGVTNITLGELKTAGAIGVGLLGAAGAPETGGASLSATLGAGYLAISSQGQVLSGTGQLYSAISGNFNTGEQIQQVGDIMSGPISGITTLVVTKNPEAAALAANVESTITLGAGAVNAETVADKIANGVDAALTFLGVGQGSCQ